MENWMAFGILTVNAVSDWRKEGNLSDTDGGGLCGRDFLADRLGKNSGVFIAAVAGSGISAGRACKNDRERHRHGGRNRNGSGGKLAGILQIPGAAVVRPFCWPLRFPYSC